MCSRGSPGAKAAVFMLLLTFSRKGLAASARQRVKSIRPRGLPRMSSMQESEWKKHSSTIFVSLGKQGETVNLTSTCRSPLKTTNFLIHENFHITINANGRVTAFVDNFSVDCR